MTITSPAVPMLRPEKVPRSDGSSQFVIFWNFVRPVGKCWIKIISVVWEDVLSATKWSPLETISVILNLLNHQRTKRKSLLSYFLILKLCKLWKWQKMIMDQCTSMKLTVVSAGKYVMTVERNQKTHVLIVVMIRSKYFLKKIVWKISANIYSLLRTKDALQLLTMVKALIVNLFWIIFMNKGENRQLFQEDWKFICWSLKKSDWLTV